MGPDRTTSATIIDDLRLPERLAVWTFRCVAQEPRICMGGNGGLAADLQPAIAALQAFQSQMALQRQPGLRVAAWGSHRLTRDECRLLRVVAALQAGALELADNLLFRFAPSRLIRLSLTQAIVSLAATLGTLGYWLDQPLEPWIFSSGAAPAIPLHENA